MTTTAHLGRHSVAWLYYPKTPVSSLPNIRGPFFNTGQDQDIRYLASILEKDGFETSYIRMISGIIYPKYESNGEKLTGQMIANEFSATVTVKYEYDDPFAEMEKKPERMWIVYQPNLPIQPPEELDVREKSLWDHAKTVVEHGESFFNVGYTGTPISSFATEAKAWDHANALVMVKKAEIKEMFGVEFHTKIWPDPVRKLSYLVIFDSQTHAAKHLVALATVAIV